MVGIRSITYQLPQDYGQKHIERIVELSRVWDKEYSFIRTQRISLCPLVEPVELQRFKDISHLCDMSSIRWFNVPIDPQKSSDPQKLFDFAYNILEEYRRTFVNVLGVTDGTIHFDVFRHYCELTRKTSMLSSNGKDNFRLGMSMNVTPDGPFFPFSYSSGRFGFSIALELTQEINKICREYASATLAELQSRILGQIVPQIDSINMIVHNIEKEFELEFKGFDFSLAPIIDEDGSVIPILNRLGVYDFENTGAMFATGYITNILKHLAYKYKSVGFSGVMYSLLEDLKLCAINNKQGVSLPQIISLSTMCGCGVDMVPVYGQITNEEMLSICLDVAGISCRMKKPLGVRLLPIVKCEKGSLCFTAFNDDADFIANTRVVQSGTSLISNPGSGFTYLPTI